MSVRLISHVRSTGHHFVSSVRTGIPSRPCATAAAAVNDEGIATVDRISSSLLGYHWETTPPRPDELRQAAAFFQRAPPKNVFTASSLHQVPFNGLPEVAFLGRSNVGKSTLLNALFAADVCRTSSKPGRTRALHAYAVGGYNAFTNQPGLITVLDMPGYGHGSRAEWGKAVAKYLARRKELRRAFLLVDSLHGLKERDELMLEELRLAGVSHQVVLGKVDRVILPQNALARNLKQTSLDANIENLKDVVDRIRQTIQPKGSRRGLHALGEILCVSADLGRYRRLSDEAGGTLGIDALRWSILTATGFREYGKKASKTEMDSIVIDKSR